jgi:hypothetical protein
MKLEVCIHIYPFCLLCLLLSGARYSVVGWGLYYATSRKDVGSIPVEVTGFLSWPNPSSHIMVMGSTQPLIEMITRNLPGHKGWLVRKGDNFTAICEPIV